MDRSWCSRSPPCASRTGCDSPRWEKTGRKRKRGEKRYHNVLECFILFSFFLKLHLIATTWAFCLLSRSPNKSINWRTVTKHMYITLTVCKWNTLKIGWHVSFMLFVVSSYPFLIPLINAAASPGSQPLTCTRNSTDWKPLAPQWGRHSRELRQEASK